MTRSVPGLLLLPLLVLASGCGGSGDGQSPLVQIPPPIPLGLEEPLPVPDDNPLTAEKVRLGKLLYFDKRLSRDATRRCGRRSSRWP